MFNHNHIFTINNYLFISIFMIILFFLMIRTMHVLCDDRNCVAKQTCSLSMFRWKIKVFHLLYYDLPPPPVPVQQPHLLTYLSFLIRWEQVWNFSCVQQIIDVLQERLLFDLLSRSTLVGKGPFKCYVTLFFWKLDPHPPPRNANNIEHYTFVTLFSRKSDTPHPHLRYVTLEWPLSRSR